MNETTIEKKLKDYKGYQVYKVTDNKGTHNETITYMLNDQDGDRFIVLSIQPDYPLKRIRPNIYYRTAINKEEKQHVSFFILNGNIYFKIAVYTGDNCREIANYYCCTIEKLRRFITRSSISQFLFKGGKRAEIETVNDLYIMTLECGCKREIARNEFYEAECGLKSDFSKP